MDLIRQRKLEPFRCIPVVGGFVLMTSGYCGARHDRQLILAALIAVPIALGVMLVGLGFASIKLRRTIFSQEERIQGLEKELLEGAGRAAAGGILTGGRSGRPFAAPPVPGPQQPLSPSRVRALLRRRPRTFAALPIGV